MPVEVTQLAKFLNGTFIIPWHFIGLLVNIATEALHEKDSSPCIFFTYFVALAVFKSITGMKENRELRFRDPMKCIYALISSVSFSMTIFPAFER